MRVQVFVVEALSLAHHQHAAKGRQARREVNHQPAAKVKRPELLDPAVGPPHPVRHRVVDQRRPEQHEDKVRREPDPFGDRPRDERCRKNSDEHLEQHEELMRNQRCHGRVWVERRPH